MKDSYFHDPYRAGLSYGPVTQEAGEEVKYPTAPRGTSKEILGWVGEDANRAAFALEREKDSDEPRPTLVDKLEKLV